MKKVEDVGQAYRRILSGLGKMVQADGQVNFDLLQSALHDVQTETLILLDGVDTVLDPDRGLVLLFIRMLRAMCSVNNRKVKLLLTSRHKLMKEWSFIHNEGQTVQAEGQIKQYELGQLTLQECQQIFTKIAPTCQDMLSSETFKKLCEDCDYSPLGVTMVATLIRDTPIFLLQDREFAEGLAMAANQQAPMLFIQNVFNNLEFKWKQKLLELSQFDSTFDLEGAQALMGNCSQSEALLDLKYLQSCHLVALQRNIRYSDQLLVPPDQQHDEKTIRILVHTLTSQLCDALMKKELWDMQYAQKRYIGHFKKKLEEIGKLFVEGQFSKAQEMTRVNDDHIRKFLQMPKVWKKKMDQQPDTSDDRIQEENFTYSTMERFIKSKDRMEYFRKEAEACRQSDDTLGYIHNKLWELEQHFQENTHFLIADPLKELKQALSAEAQDMVGVRLLWAKYKYIHGRFLYFERKYPEALKELKESVELYSKKGTDDMNGIFLARTVNMIGSVYYMMGEPDQALKYHQEAYDLVLQVVPSKLQFDLPTYILNIGTAYHVKGHNTDDEEERAAFYEKALESYDESLKLYRDLKIYGFSHTANMLQSKATVLCDMKRFHEAVEPAEEAKTIMLLHHPTSHLKIFEICYLTGSIYVDLAEETSSTTSALSNWKKAVENFEQATEYVFGYSGVPLHNHYYKKLTSSLPRALRKINEENKAEIIEDKFKEYEGDLVQCMDSGKAQTEAAVANGDTTEDEGKEEADGKGEASPHVLTNGPQEMVRLNDIITRHAVFMVQNIDVMRTPLWEALMTAGVIGHTQCDGIKDTCPSNLLQVSALVRHLRRRSFDDWRKFLQCLREHDHAYVADQLVN